MIDLVRICLCLAVVAAISVMGSSCVSKAKHDRYHPAERSETIWGIAISKQEPSHDNQ